MGYPIAATSEHRLDLGSHSGRVAGTSGRWGVIPDWVWSAQGRPGSDVSPLRLARVLQTVGDRLNFQQIRAGLMQESPSGSSDENSRGA